MVISREVACEGMHYRTGTHWKAAKSKNRGQFKVDDVKVIFSLPLLVSQG
jgi:hypothetical protein